MTNENNTPARPDRAENSLPGEYSVSPHVRVALDDYGATILDIRAGRIFRSNGIAAEMWRAISSGRDSGALAAEMSSRYGVPQESVLSDFREFLNDLEKKKLAIHLLRRKIPSRAALLTRAFCELIRYDLRMLVLGFSGMYRELASGNGFSRTARIDPATIQVVVNAVSTVAGFYWKPVKCLQKSTVIARLLRQFGIPAKLTIGYRTIPFMSHAWVEVDRRVVSDSEALPERLAVLLRI